MEGKDNQLEMWSTNSRNIIKHEGKTTTVTISEVLRSVRKTQILIYGINLWSTGCNVCQMSYDYTKETKSIKIGIHLGAVFLKIIKHFLCDVW